MIAKEDNLDMKNQKKIVSEINILKEQILGVKSPEMLFGPLEGKGTAKLAGLNGKYFNMMRRFKLWRSLAEDIRPQGVEETFEVLSDLYRIAQERIRSGKYSEKLTLAVDQSSTVLAILEGNRFTYHLHELISEGDVANVYIAEYLNGEGEKKQACVKVAKNKGDNELLENEQNILCDLDHISLPKSIEGFEMGDGRAVSVLGFVDGYNFHQLRSLALHKDGLENPNYHIGWILERGLALLGYLHSKGIIHGSVEPAHLVVNPKTHNVSLVDFCWAVQDPNKKDHIKIAQEYYSAPEIFTKSLPNPKMDIFGLGKSVVYLLGGDPEYATTPDSLHAMYKNFLENMTEDGIEGRTSDAYQAAHILTIIRNEVSGEKRKFVPLLLEKERKVANG